MSVQTLEQRLAELRDLRRRAGIGVTCTNCHRRATRAADHVCAACKRGEA